MTQFLFWMGNHNEAGQRSLEDVIGIFGHQIRALGHQAIWNPKNDQFLDAYSGINVIVEGFTEHTVRTLKSFHDQGARFLILATEEPTPKGFNHGRDQEMVKRQKVFPEAAKFCEGIIHLVPGEHVSNWYGQFAPTAYTELGYAPSLMRNPSAVQPTYDFGFYGSISRRRLKILKRLANTVGTVKAVRVVGDFRSQDERDKMMQEAKVIVQIRKFDEMGLVSSSRCNTALCLGRPIVAEPHLLSKPWDEIVRFSSSLESFYAEALLVRSMWQGVHQTQFAKFKAKLSPQDCVGKAFQQINLDLSDRKRKSA